MKKMGKITYKLRILLRKILVSLGIVIAPYVAHAGYSMADRGPANTPINGTVRSLDTGDPIVGLRVIAAGSGIRNGGYETKTNADGYFHLLVPEVERYNLYLDDFDEELNGGFFGENTKTFEFSDIQNDLNILLKEENLVTIHGFVRSRENNAAISEIRIQLDMPGSRIGYATMTNSNGSFSIRVPEKENYKIFITDSNDFFMEKIKEIKLNDTRNSLDIVLEEERIITIRGIVYSKTKMQIIEGIQVSVYFPRIPVWATTKRKVYTVLTNNEGYFEVRIPERSGYDILIRHSSTVYTTEEFSITKPVDDEIIELYSEKY
jgi:hypothetical protein